MKPIIYLCFSLLFLVFLSSCGCPERDRYESYLSPVLVNYFGMYKTGSYWVYENQDKTKRDSIYVSSYERYIRKNNNICSQDEIMKFTIKSNDKQMIYSDSVCARGEGEGLDFQNCPSSTFRTSMTFIDFYKYPDELIVSGSVVEVISEVTLNQEKYSGEIIHIYDQDAKSVFIKEHIGFIGFITPPDTFSLVNYHFQP
jgi:hypothetical protein